MRSRITKTEVRSLAERIGHNLEIEVLVRPGSTINGVGWHLQVGQRQIFLGMSAREAHDRLEGMLEGIYLSQEKAAGR